MLTEQRHEIILKLLKDKRSITVKEIKNILGSSDSTIRRDLTELDLEGKLTKVFGGAVANEPDADENERELSVSEKSIINVPEKRRIGKYAAKLIEPDDCVYIDAGTTTEYMLDFLIERNATYVTNAANHARKLAKAGFNVFLIGGELKGNTEATVGSYAIRAIERFNFSKGFFGANGINLQRGITTPDASEALVKEAALRCCVKKYILADNQKFDRVSSVTFADMDEVSIITDAIPDRYRYLNNIIKAE